MTCTFYVFKITESKGVFYGYGISSNFENRKRSHEESFSSYNATGQVVYTREFRTAEEARFLENRLKQTYDVSNTIIPGFKTESINVEDYDDLMAEVLDFNLSYDDVVALQSEKIDRREARIFSRAVRELGIPRYDLNKKAALLCYNDENNASVYKHIVDYLNIIKLAKDRNVSKEELEQAFDVYNLIKNFNLHKTLDAPRLERKFGIKNQHRNYVKLGITDESKRPKDILDVMLLIDEKKLKIEDVLNLIERV
jgi:predicted GIY-YIG superfamily endonuclease